MSLAFDRRAVLGGFAALAAAPGLARPSAPIVTRSIELPVGSRTMTARLAAPAKVQGVALFSHGAGGSPDLYPALFERLNWAGLAVFAPVHTDSSVVPQDSRSNLRQALLERLADFSALSAYADTTYPRVAQVAVGHSYGSLISQIAGGALAYLGAARLPSVRGVLAFSGPGKIPGLVRPDAYATLAVPMLLVTGTRDAVPGYFTDWRDQLLAVETSPQFARAVVLDEADHGGLVREPALARPWPGAIAPFLRAVVRGDLGAAKALERWRPAGADQLIRGEKPWR